jgi:hypothetical protein
MELGADESRHPVAERRPDVLDVVAEVAGAPTIVTETFVVAAPDDRYASAGCDENVSRVALPARSPGPLRVG